MKAASLTVLEKYTISAENHKHFCILFQSLSSTCKSTCANFWII